MDPSNENPSSGASTLSNLSQSRSDTTKDDEPKNDTGLPSSSYAISSNGETTDLHGALALRPREGSTSTGEGKSSDEDREGQHGKSQDQPASGQDGGAGAGDEGSSGDKAMSDEHETGIKTDGTKAEPKVMKEYSNEARCYHTFYDELQRAHMRGHYTWCRNNCLNFLLEPRIPMWTRIQTLQLLSTMLQPAGGEQCLEEVDQLIDMLPHEEFQTQLLREDNRKMKADRMEWRIKNDMVGKEIEGVGENPNEGPSDEQLKEDRDADEKLRQELEEEMEASRKSDVEMADEKAPGMLPLASSET